MTAASAAFVAMAEGCGHDFQKADEALAELAKLDLTKVAAGVWKAAVLSAHGQAYAAAGRKAEAIAKYKEALRMEGVPVSARQTGEKALQELQSEKPAGQKPPVPEP